MTPFELETLKAHLAKATPAPWGAYHKTVKEEDAVMIAFLRNYADELVRGYEAGKVLREVVGWILKDNQGSPYDLCVAKNNYDDMCK